MAIRLIFLAPPGAGKGTQARRMQESFKVFHLSTGDALRAAVTRGTAAGKKAKSYMDEGGLVPDEIVLQIVSDSLRNNEARGWILDGFPRSEQQAVALDKILTDLKEIDYKVIYFEVPDATLLERVAGRYQEAKREDDKSEVALRRLAIYREKTYPLIGFYEKLNRLVVIDGNQEIDQVFETLKTALSLKD